MVLGFWLVVVVVVESITPMLYAMVLEHASELRTKHCICERSSGRTCSPLIIRAVCPRTLNSFSSCGVHGNALVPGFALANISRFFTKYLSLGI